VSGSPVQREPMSTPVERGRGLSPRGRRLAWVLGGVAVLAVATGLVLYALSSNIVFFFSPSQVAANEAPKGRSFRIGGLVEPDSVKREGIDVRFRVTDGAQTIAVLYRGTLPDLFREGKGVVAQGTLEPDGVFKASEVLAKHDENYMPPEAAEALKKGGHPMHSGSVKP
jgi:cytochrome c-type biogenesis protein CcmE